MDGLLALFALFLLVATVVSPFVVIHLLSRVRELEKRQSADNRALSKLRSELDLLQRPDPSVQPQRTAPKAPPTPEPQPPTTADQARSVQSADSAPEKKPLGSASPEPPFIPAAPPAVASSAPQRPKPQPNPSTPPQPASEGLATIVLKKIDLMPPKPEEEGSNLMAWWSTRIGLAFGIIAAVFLGLYVNQDTVPWIRLLELVLASGAVFALGCWFEKKLANFGRALTAGGLGLLYVSAYAAYGLPAMKVTDSATVGALTQTLALGLMVTWALWRGREPVFGLAMALGFITCWFSATEGLSPVALIALVILSFTGSLLFALKGWWSGIWAALAGSALGLSLLAIAKWTSLAGPPQWLAILVALTVALFPLVALSRQWLAGRHEAKRLIPVATSLGLLAGAVGTYTRGFDYSPYYAAFALFFILVGWWWRRDGSEGLWQTLWAKASVLIAMLLIASFEGPVRSFSLLAQAGGLLFLARTRSRPIFEVGALLAAIAGWHYLPESLTNRPINFWRASDGFALGYLLITQALLVTYRQLLGEDLIRRFVAGGLTALVASLFTLTATSQVEFSWDILLPFAFGLLCLGQAWPLRQKDSFLAPLVILLATLISLSSQWELGNPVAYQALTWLVLAWSFYLWVRTVEKVQPFFAGPLVLLTSPIALTMATQQLCGLPWSPLVGLGTGLLWLLVGRRLKDEVLSSGAILPALLGSAYFCFSPSLPSSIVNSALVLVAAIAWWTFGYLASSKQRTVTVFRVAHTLPVALVLLPLLAHYTAGTTLVILAIVFSVLVHILWKYLHDETLPWLALALAGQGLIELFFKVHLHHTSPGIIALVGILLASNGIWLAHHHHGGILSRPKWASVFWGSSAILILFLGWSSSPSLANLVTASWAIAAVSLLIAGFWFGMRGYRFMGLAGLAATFIRLFSVDIQNSFWRIVAFAITGALLVGIGYLYNRFHKRLAHGDLDWGTDDEQGEAN